MDGKFIIMRIHLAVVLLAGALAQARAEPVATPIARRFPDAVLEPRVLYVRRVFDKSLPHPGQKEWDAVLRDFPRLMERLFGVRATLKDLGEVAPEPYFTKFEISLKGPKGGLEGLIVPAAKDRPAFVKQVQKTLDAQDPAQVRRYLPTPTSPKLKGHALADAVVRTFEMRARGVLAGQASMAKAFPPERLGLVTMGAWTALLQHQHEVEILVTNVPLVYSYRDGSALHALVRGGIIGGFCTFGGGSKRYTGASVVTLFPLVSPAPSVKAIGGEELPWAALPPTIAALMAHELSHLMFRLPDNYNHVDCIMHPPPGIDYHRFWFQQHPIKPCLTCNRSARGSEFGRRASDEERRGRLEAAFAHHRSAVLADPQVAERLNGAAWFTFDHHMELEQGLEWARSAVKLAPRAAHILDTLGWGEYLAGRVHLAVGHLEEARVAEGKSHSPEIAAHLALALFAKGDYAGALKLLPDVLQGSGRALLSEQYNRIKKSVDTALSTGRRFF